MNATLAAALTLGFILAGGVAAVTLDAFSARRAAVAAGALGLFGGALAAGLGAMTRSAAVWGVLRSGGAYSVIGCVIAVLAGVAVAGGSSELARREWGGSLVGLIAFGAAASVVVAQSKDLVLLLIALETAAACGYALVASGDRSGSREAAMKYFVQGAIATAFFVFGMAVLITVFLPTGDIDALSKALPASHVAVPATLVGIVLLLSALAFKAGAVPFHSWAPDAYESAAPSSAAFLATGPKVAAIAALAVIASIASQAPFTLQVEGVLVILAVLSVLVGSVTALRQRSYTRMLGYAGVAQVGYALVAVATTHQPMVAIFFISTYALASTGTFLAAAAFREVRPDWDGTVQGLAGIGRKAPVLGVSASVLVISLAGIPPLVGFWSKFAVFLSAAVGALVSFSAANTVEGWFAIVAAVAGVVGSVVSLGYYGGVLRAIFAPAETPEAQRADDASMSVANGLEEAAPRPIHTATAAVVVLALAVVAIGLVPLVSGLDALVRIFA